ncbi:fibrobacter succinogenes major paralogous domain-containing protein [Williamwhitmania taraxaci]|uniref:Major paralogous domain-containing protein n=1 Tax=Williamwhitmania taraxaci TaxID=1640674 RepID=A0A1G6T8D2_9BACT|nr:fibrobacter succinogenes major paralogous domain-containing protein [Williamwhitmania taraxaci]SDD25308.1 major paralogous domain-containing protein [Williamwhitmania taraxaci]
MKKQLINLLCAAMVLYSVGLASCCKDKDDDTPRVGQSTAVFNPDKTYGTMTDTEGNVYRTITIGTQTWMAENLRTTRYRNGDPIPNGATTDWPLSDNTPGGYCSYNNTSDPDTIVTYGLLYNGYAVLDGRNLAPEGWHIPTAAEWDTLIAFVAAGEGTTDMYGSNSIAGGRLREAGTLHWGRANRATNSSGFTALPGGHRGPGKPSFNQVGYTCNFWSATLYDSFILYYYNSCPDFLSFGKMAFTMPAGFSVRCVKN